ncbi:MAG: hypothetical protein HY646_05930 [Acidobacteria bacterium]|nr:hypothetical protein [Acidobacteriota bacterium]
MNTNGRNWGGFLFLHGLMEVGAATPSLNFGDKSGSAGTDLRGATKLTFWAIGARGGEKIEFFVAGAGRDPVSDRPLEKHQYPDSTGRIPRIGTLITLSNVWKQYTIDLKGKDLRYILNGLGWTASALHNSNGAVFFVDDIEFDKPRLDETRFIVSYVTTKSDGDFDRTQRSVAFTYDNALVMLAFMARGTEDDWRRAKLLGDAFVYAQTHDRHYTDGRLRNAYQAGDLWLPPGWSPTGKPATARMAGIWDCKKGAWLEDAFQVSTHTGNVAWPMIALLTYHKKRPNPAYLEAALKMGEWIEQRAERSGFLGYRGGFEGWEPRASEVAWTSTEHNLDVLVAFRKLFDATGDLKWLARADHARAFVEKMWDENSGCFMTGTNNGSEINRRVLPLDVQAWSVLAMPDELNRFGRALQCAETKHRTIQDNFTGYAYDAADRDGVWFEGTAQMAVAYARGGQMDMATQILEQLRRAQAAAPNANGKGIVAASRELTTGFLQTGSDRPLMYFPRLHIGATAWYVFGELGVNPYHLW